ncbi:MAG: tail fiber domain-containing protein [Candidatus Omnitrophota bacterium]
MNKSIVFLMVLMCSVVINVYAADGDLIVEGKLGVGTTTPAFNLVVASPTVSSNIAVVDSADSDNRRAQMGHSDNNGGNLILWDDSNNLNVNLSSYGSSYLNGGNVGIGTTAPQARLSLGTGTGAKLLTYDNGTGINQGLFLDSPNPNDLTFATHHTGALVFGKTQNTATPTFGTEWMRISNNGAVGIGTNNPYERLHVSTPGFHVMGLGATSAGGSYWDFGIGDSALGFPGVLSIGYMDAAPGGIGGGPHHPVLALKNNGNVGIGTTNPAFNLVVASPNVSSNIAVVDSADSNNRRAQIGHSDYNGGSLILWDDSNNLNVLLNSNGASYLNGGNVGIGTTTPSKKLYVNGTAGGTSAWQYPSDERLKQNIKTIDNALEKVLKLRGVNFEWKDQENYAKGTQVGLIAQEVKEVVPEVVSKDGEYYSLSGSNLVGILVEAIKEQNKLIEELRVEVNKLKAEKVMD